MAGIEERAGPRERKRRNSHMAALKPGLGFSCLPTPV
jgi:hypothetical protein